ncbi:MAG: phosphoglucosamine mutase [Frankiales bacterium]|nr:phosphoglucosamine mutase [Frankiales bacterium]
MRLFGTDGVRGVANVDLTADLALGLARAAVAELAPPGSRPLAVVGRDPRPSGELLESAVVAGLLASGADVVRLGVVPTPAVAHALTVPLVGDAVATVGVMISASHNPMPDNGIKFFGPGGVKLSDAVEERIEQRLDEAREQPSGTDVGRLRGDLSGDTGWYVDHVTKSIDRSLSGIRVVVDCANGAAAIVAPAAYRAAGADVVVINDDLSGERINDNCGATHLDGLRTAVVQNGADLGLAHDGDADRCLAVDAAGEVVDGDQILAVLALALHERGALANNTVVATVMSNLGFRQAMAAAGIEVAETPVGDRYVLERMRSDGLAIGGEQSGHLVIAAHAQTGDGILAGLHLMARMAETGCSLADLASVVVRLPQVLVNVRVTDKAAAMAALDGLVGDAQRELGDTGRILVRPSGTEPLLRIMVEAPSETIARSVADRLAAQL